MNNMPSDKNPRVLVIDDNRAIHDDSTSRIVLSATLQKLGHQVSVTNGGSEALGVFEFESISLLISDMVTPDVDGLELCRRIRAAGHSQYTYCDAPGRRLPHGDCPECSRKVIGQKSI